MYTELFSDQAHSSPVTLVIESRYVDLKVTAGSGVHVSLTGPDEVHERASARLVDGSLHIDVPVLADSWKNSWRGVPRDFKSTIEVSLPAGSSVDAKLDVGSVKTTGPLTSVDVKTNAGSVTVEQAERVFFKGDAASLKVGRVSSLDAKCDAGQIKADHVADGVVTTSAGRISIGEVINSLTAKADAGAIRVKYAGPCDIDAKSSLGSIRIAVAKGIPVYADCHAIAGSVRTDLKESAEPTPGAPVARIKARTDLGSIKLERADARLDH
ncbi:hypothetical protein BSZ39_09215 [Bowdeniella nasicola]|uniref:Adhesin domain-containing protein n=1 Tax=Bowdeniella nasicola TaxID=208480 RepID=A0A1Q5Q114_9ACTO|nr:DUF4097 family beta strand repeat-containing protein [Bowdeniella nasicola]OKL53487.1 hypothetical protein BSZ39_09215 [Bowdeniella nasicola]